MATEFCTKPSLAAVALPRMPINGMAGCCALAARDNAAAAPPRRVMKERRRMDA